ncbi:MAG: GDSL-type esterase/lipase family protein [Myxococcales bacterium]|nr:GDSL-type esterase/lipase family protein [Myxococcales bacterium]
MSTGTITAARRRGGRPLGTWGGRLALIIASVLLTFGAAEGILRLVGYSYVPMKIEVANRSLTDFRYHHILADDHHEFDAELFWRPRASTSVFNSQGYRGKELSEQKPPNAIRILAVGDSNTLGWFEEGLNWPQYLEQLLDQPEVTVTNAGVWGYSSHQGLARFKRALRFEPDAVIISFGGNDAHGVNISDWEFARRRARESVYSRLRLGQLWLAAAEGRRAKQGLVLVPRVSVERYEAHLEAMLDIAERRGIEVLLLTRPYVGPLPPWNSWKRQAPQYHAATVHVATAHSAPLIDVFAEFRDQDRYFRDESHFNDEGHHRMARMLYDRHVRALVERLRRH